MLQIEKTSNKPEVKLDFENGILDIKGRSYPEYPELFYKSIEDGLDKVTTSTIILTLDFEYLNTSSTKCILNLLKICKENFKTKDIKVIWIYDEDDDDIKEVGEDFSDLTNIGFKFIEKIEC